jgi:hypothetical protein
MMAAYILSADPSGTARHHLQGWLVNQLAQADIRRRFWEPLERVAVGFERMDLPYRKQHGGQILLATGVKPG